LSDDITPGGPPAGVFAWREAHEMISARFADRILSLIASIASEKKNAAVRTSLKKASELSLARCEFIAVV
jgi:hypothetical protein